MISALVVWSYFDTQACQASGKLKYGQLVRSEQGSCLRVLTLGRPPHTIASTFILSLSHTHTRTNLRPGADTSGDRVSQEGIRGDIKKHSADFALWMSAEPDKPFWESPWGLGRPGWHIECSAAASGIFGSLLHIHSGGIDLQFPHHNNEIAQTEGFYDQPAWTQYWLHTGHLHIQGCKTRKSLGNCIAVQDCLTEHSPHILCMPSHTAGSRSNLVVGHARVEESRQILEQHPPPRRIGRLPG